MKERIETMWTSAAVARFLCVSRQTLYRWRMTGNGPPVCKIGGQLRFVPDDVRKWALSQQDRPRVW